MMLMLSRTGLGIWAHMNLPRRYRGGGGGERHRSTERGEKKKVKESIIKERGRDWIKNNRHRGVKGERDTKLVR